MTSGRTGFEEVDYETPAEPAQRQLRLGPVGRPQAVRQPGLREAAEAKAPRQADSRLRPRRGRRQLLDHRRRGRPRPGLTNLYGRYLYADFCAGQLRSFVPTLGGAQGDRALDDSFSSPTSFTASPFDDQDLRDLAGVDSVEQPRLRGLSDRDRPSRRDGTVRNGAHRHRHRDRRGRQDGAARSRGNLRRPPPHRRLGDPHRPESTRPSGWPRWSRACAPPSPSGRRSDTRAATAGSAGSRLDLRQPRPARRRDAGGDGQGPRRRRDGGAVHLRLDQLLGQARPTTWRTRRRRRTNPMFKVKRLRITYRPYPVVGVDQAVELPADPRLRRRDSGADGRRGGRDQAVRGDAARRDGDRPRLEGHRRARRARDRERRRGDRWRPDRQRRLPPVHRLGADRARS